MATVAERRNRRKRAVRRKTDRAAAPDERLRRLLECTRAVPWEADATTWRFTYVGPQAAWLLGYPPEAWYTEGFWTEHLHPDDRESATKFCLERSKSSTDYDFQYRMLARDGHSVWIHDVVSVESVDGVPKTLVGFMIDITAQKDQDECTQASELMLRGILEAAPDAMVVADRSGQIVLANQRTSSLFGYTRGELLGRAVETLMPKRFRQRHVDHRADYFSDPHTREMAPGMELRAQRKDGSEFPAEIALSPLTVQGETTVISVIRDVTERLKAAAKAAELEALFEDLYENAPDIYLSVDAATTEVVRCNETATRTLGYTREEMVGRTVFALYHQDCSQQARQVFQSFLRTGQVEDTELRLVRKDGEAVDVSVSVSAIRDAHGRIVATRSVLRDISRRKQAERQAQERLQQLAHANRISTMGELTASLAHEIKQPLTAILSNAQAAQRFLSAEPPDLSELGAILADIVKDDRRAGEVIRRLRSLFVDGALAKMEALSLSEVVAEVLPLIRSDAIIRGVTIATEFDSRLPSVRGDRVQLQQVVLNLLLNGAEAMKNCRLDDRVLTVRTAHDGPENVVVSIQDCGIGLVQENLAQLFIPFYTTKADGMGIGLSIARSIVESHSGRLWATNNPDRGATFSFSLPVEPRS